jgi:GxxExxY protein
MNKMKEELEQIAEQVMDAMLKVHRALGPGLLESTYQTCLAHELRCRAIEVLGVFAVKRDLNRRKQG